MCQSTHTHTAHLFADLHQRTAPQLVSIHKLYIVKRGEVLVTEAHVVASVGQRGGRPIVRVVSPRNLVGDGRQKWDEGPDQVGGSKLRGQRSLGQGTVLKWPVHRSSDTGTALT